MLLTSIVAEYFLTVVIEFRLCFGSTQVVEEMTKMDRVVVLDLDFDCRPMLSHLNIYIDLRAYEAWLCDKGLLYSDDFICTVYIIDD